MTEPALPDTSGSNAAISAVPTVNDAQSVPYYQPRAMGSRHMTREGTWLSRVGWFILFAIPLAVVITATTLTPAPEGHSTHMQLGLPACGFLEYTGIPCPGCGLTTCFTHMVRFEFVGATRANPFGVMLFFVTFFTIPIAAWGFIKKRPVLDTLEDLHFEKWAILLCICSMLVWGIRVAKQLAT